MTCEVSRSLKKERKKQKKGKRARGSCYRWWVRFSWVQEQLSFSLVVQSSCEPGSQALTLCVQAISEPGQISKAGERVPFFMGYWEYLISDYSEIKMLPVLPSHCVFYYGVRTWSKGAFQ